MTLYSAILVVFVGFCSASEPNPPSWPDHVYVFDPATPSTTQNIVSNIYKENGGTNPCDNGQWSTDQYAFLFMPGDHKVNVDIGYYTSLYGLGVSPSDTQIQGVASWEGCNTQSVGALSTFWRSAENFQIGQDMQWSVSQAAPLRKARVIGNLKLSQSGYSSGGYLSDSYVTGTVYPGSQQQWFTRNTYFNYWDGGNWNMVFVGCNNQPATHCSGSGGHAYTSVPATPVIAEKPFIVLNSNGNYSLYVPQMEANKYGNTKDYETISTIIDFSNVYVATTSSSVSTINAKLAAGTHVIITPGNYEFEESIVINNDNAVLMGIGFPVISATNGNALITVGNNDGVRIVGPMILQGGSKTSDTLLQIGEKGYGGSQSNPVFLYDIFGRIGGPNNPNDYQMRANSMVTINSGYTVYDNTWLWRADHGVTGEIYNEDNPVNNGLIVNGDNVMTYGLAVEHTLQDLVQWNGNNGQVYFYQSEFPYDVTSDYQTNGYTSVRISGQNFMGLGMGAYTYFRDHYVVVDSCFVGPNSNKNLTNSLGVFLSGQGGFKHIYNDEGTGREGSFGVEYLCEA